MTTKSLIIRFAWLYPLLLIVITLVAYFAGVAGGQLGYILLFTLVLYLVQNFVRENRRLLTEKEKKSVFFGIWAVYSGYFIAISALGGLAAGASLMNIISPAVVKVGLGAIFTLLGVNFANKEKTIPEEKTT